MRDNLHQSEQRQLLAIASAAVSALFEGHDAAANVRTRGGLNRVYVPRHGRARRFEQFNSCVNVVVVFSESLSSF